MNPKVILTNQFGEVSENVMSSDDQSVYSGAHSYQVLPADMQVAAGAGSNTAGDPKFLAAIMGNILGAALTKVGNYLAGVIGAYSITGTKTTRWPAGGVVGIVSDGVTDVDGAVVAHLDGDSALTVANAAFKASMKNSTPNSGFNYGLDLTQAGVDGFPALAILKADLRLSHDICVLNSATTPVNGGSGTGANFAGPGSICIARDTGIAYQNTNTKASPTWTKMISSLAQAAHQANSTAADTAAMVVDFNALLAKLQASGLMAGS